MAYRVTFIPGDGVGPELSEATRRVLEATGVKFDWDVQHAGLDVMDYDERWGRYRIRVTPEDLKKNREVLRQVVAEAFRAASG